MTLTKKQITTILLLLGLIFGIFLTIYLVKQRQEIRPKALTGPGNLLLSTTTTSTTVGAKFDVLVSLHLEDDELSASGADFVLLYDKNRLEVKNILPKVPSVVANAPFTDAPVVTYNGDYDETFNFARVSLIANKNSSALQQNPKTLSLATITFRAKNIGQATIKFLEGTEDVNYYQQVVGIDDNSIPPTNTPGPTNPPTVTPPGPTDNPSPTPNGGVNIIGFVWNDLRKDAVKDSLGAVDEQVLSGVTLKLRKKLASGKYETVLNVDSDAGDNNRNYVFYGVRPGDYRIAAPSFPGYKLLPCAQWIRPADIPNRGFYFCMKDGSPQLRRWSPGSSPPYIIKPYFHVEKDAENIKVMIPLIPV